MTTQTFEFQKSSRWTLFKMFFVAFLDKKLTMAWVDESAPEIHEQSLEIRNLTGQTVEVNKTAEGIDIHVSGHV